MYLDFNDFPIKLRNGETIHVSELCLNRLNDPNVKQIILSKISPLDWVPYIEEDVMNEAKRGLDINFKDKIGVPPEAALKRVKSGLCAERKTCASYKYEECLLRIKPKYEKKEFPRCWMVDEPDQLIREVITSVIFKWREGRRVIVSF